MSKLSISALEEEWDVLENIHSEFVHFWAAQPQVGERFLGLQCSWIPTAALAKSEIDCLVLIW